MPFSMSLPRAARLAVGLLVAPAAIDVSVVVPSALAAPGPSSGLRLTGVKISGNQQVATADIMTALPFHVGETVTTNDLTAGLGKVADLYKQRNVGAGFQMRRRLVNKTVSVDFIIQEQAPGAAPAATALVLDRVVFTGNAKVPTSELEAAVALQPGQTVTDDIVTQATNRVQAVYKKHGVGSAIQPKAEYPSHDNHVVLTYDIKETAPSDGN